MNRNIQLMGNLTSLSHEESAPMGRDQLGQGYHGGSREDETTVITAIIGEEEDTRHTRDRQE